MGSGFRSRRATSGWSATTTTSTWRSTTRSRSTSSGWFTVGTSIRSWTDRSLSSDAAVARDPRERLRSRGAGGHPPRRPHLLPQPRAPFRGGAGAARCRDLRLAAGPDEPGAALSLHPPPSAPRPAGAPLGAHRRAGSRGAPRLDACLLLCLLPPAGHQRPPDQGGAVAAAQRPRRPPLGHPGAGAAAGAAPSPPDPGTVGDPAAPRRAGGGRRLAGGRARRRRSRLRLGGPLLPTRSRAGKRVAGGPFRPRIVVPAQPKRPRSLPARPLRPAPTPKPAPIARGGHLARN